MTKLIAPKITPGDWSTEDNVEVFSLQAYTSICMVLQIEHGKANARFLAGSKKTSEAAADFVTMYFKNLGYADSKIGTSEYLMATELRTALISQGYSYSEQE